MKTIEYPEDIDQCEIGEQFIHIDMVWLKIAQGSAALVLDELGNPVTPPTIN